MPSFAGMSEFTLPLAVSGHIYIFRFTPISGGEADKYFINAQPTSGGAVCFEMKKNYLGRWKVLQPVPAHMAEMEERLSDFINDRNG